MATENVIACHLERLIALESELDLAPEHKKLKQAWGVMMARLQPSSEGILLNENRPLFGDYGDHPLLAFSAIVKKGLFPPPELMLWLFSTLSEYLEGGGQKQLEEVFFGKLEQHRGGGNFAHRINRDRDLAALLLGLEDYLFTNPEMDDLREAVIILLPNHTKIQIDSLLHRLRDLDINQANWVDALSP